VMSSSLAETMPAPDPTQRQALERRYAGARACGHVREQQGHL